MAAPKGAMRLNQPWDPLGLFAPREYVQGTEVNGEFRWNTFDPSGSPTGVRKPLAGDPGGATYINENRETREQRRADQAKAELRALHGRNEQRWLLDRADTRDYRSDQLRLERDQLQQQSIDAQDRLGILSQQIKAQTELGYRSADTADKALGIQAQQMQLGNLIARGQLELATAQGADATRLSERRLDIAENQMEQDLAVGQRQLKLGFITQAMNALRV